MQAYEELRELAKKLSEAGAFGDEVAVAAPTDAVRDAAKQVGRSFSGSWLGYHSQVYYNGLVPPPPGARFSQEWGLKEMGVSS